MANTNTEIIALLQTDPSQAIRGVLDTLYLYNPATVNDLIEKLNEVIVQGGFEAIVVDTLPETGVKGTIYFVPSGGETPNVYNEYVWVTETEKFEMVGSAQVDLSNYYTKDEIDEQLIEIVGYVGDQTRPIRNDLNQLNQNTLKVANWVNAKDENGNRAVLETEAQDAYRAINELNAKIGSGGASLPDQTDNAGKFLTTDGTTASWGNALKNDAPAEADGTTLNILGTLEWSGEYFRGYQSVCIGADSFSTSNSVVIGYKANSGTHGRCVAIGEGAKCTNWDGVAIGMNAKAEAYAIAIGSSSSGSTAGPNAIVIGRSASATGNSSIQLGYGQNNTDDTFQVKSYRVLEKDGTIPTDRYTTTPTTAGTYVPKLTIAEDGTASREWGTASGGASGDYLPLSGGTLTGALGFTQGNAKHKIRPLPSGLINFDVSNSLGNVSATIGFEYPGNIIPGNSYKQQCLGGVGRYWNKVYATKLCNGADINIPTEGGTLARLEDLNDITTVTIKEYD